ncbi:MAG: hypothetical protein IT355_20575 [Gemmatimonadaceae bacterium]|nr:hypothetical protein [Gemmatimonadaceae bacterium]
MPISRVYHRLRDRRLLPVRVARSHRLRRGVCEMEVMLVVALVAMGAWGCWRLMGAKAGDKTARADPIPSRLPRKAAQLAPDSAPVATPASIPFTITVSHEATVEDDDRASEDEWAAVASQPVRCTVDVDLRYRDAGGTVTRRRVTVQEFDYAAPRYMFAYCHLRRARRTFYLARVEEAVDPETGEVLDSLHEFLRGKYETSPEVSLDRLFAVQRNAMRVLLYVGKADGRLMAAERAIIHRVARELTGDDRLTDRQIDKVLGEFTAPSKAVFQTCIRTMVKEEALERRLLVLRGAEDMVATQATVHPDEQSALDYMRERLTKRTDVAISVAREPVAGLGVSLEDRQRDAAAQLAQQREAWRQQEEREAADAAAEALLPTRCGYCFFITGSRLPVPVGAPIGTRARCDRCGFEQVLTEDGAKRPEKFLIAYRYRGVPVPAGVTVPHALPRGGYGELIGAIEQRRIDTEAALQALIEAFSARTIAEPAYSTEKARIIRQGDEEVVGLNAKMQDEIDSLYAEEHTARQRLKDELEAATATG